LKGYSKPKPRKKEETKGDRNLQFTASGGETTKKRLRRKNPSSKEILLKMAEEKIGGGKGERKTAIAGRDTGGI